MTEQAAVVPGSEPGGATKPVSHGLTVQQAVAERLAQLQSARQEAVPPTAATQADGAADAEATNQGESPESEEAAGVEGESQVDGEQAEAGEGDDSGDEVTLSANSVIVMPDGTRLTAEELQSGYLKNKDYTRKTQLLKDQERAMTTYVQEVRSKVGAVEQDLRSRYDGIQQMLADVTADRDRHREGAKKYADGKRERLAEWDKVDWQKLEQEQPHRVAGLWRQREMERQELEKAEADHRKLEEETQAEQEQRINQQREAYARDWLGRRQSLLEHVKTKHPVFTDPAKGNAEWGMIADMLKNTGMSEDVIQAAFGARHDPNVPLVSPPMFEIIRKAALYDAALAQVTKATAPGKPLPNGNADLTRIRVSKGEAPRFRPPSADKAAVGRAQAQYNKTGSLQDGVKLELAKLQSRIARQAR